MDIQRQAAADAPYWAWVNKLHIDGRPFDLEGRGYQMEIMRSKTDDGKIKTNEVIRKGSQIGITMGKVIEITHGALHGLYPQGIIYYFPSAKAVEHFSTTRFKPFISDNDMVRKHCSDINAVAIRRIAKTNVNFFGCSATVRIGGHEKDSNAVRSTPADWILLDERDLFDPEMAKQVNQRLGNSKINRRTDLGTPKLPDDGVDLIYGKSDMRRWQIKCGVCGKHTCMESDFPNCIGLLEGVGFPRCIHCGEKIERAKGAWIPDAPQKDVVGYWVSQLLNPNRDLAHVLKESQDPEAYDTNEAEFQRTVMGLPFIASEDRLTEADVYGCCDKNTPMAYSHNGPCAAGWDVGPNALHVVIGHKITNDRFRIVRTARVPDFDALHDLLSKYNIKAGVGDAQPEVHKMRDFQKQESFGVYLCYYQPHLKSFDSWDQDIGVVKVNRTEVFDATHRMVVSPGKLLIPRHCSEIQVFAHQLTCAAKSLEENGNTGTMEYRYRKIGDKQDHYRNALNYFYLACKKVGVPESQHSRKRATTQNMDYKL